MKLFIAQGRFVSVALIAILSITGLATPLFAQSGGNLDLRTNVIGGGGTTSGGGSLQTSGTIGQPSANSSSGGNILIQGGFWQAVRGVASSLPVVQFSAASYTVNEGSPRVDLTLNRSGDTTSSASVNFSTIDSAGLTNCNVFNGIASPRCDFINTIGTMTFAAGETSKSFSIAIIDDSYAEGNETFTVGLSGTSSATLGTRATATVTIIDNDAVTGPNPIDNTNFFVRQQYIDFLNREPDPPGFGGIETLEQP